MGVYKISYFEKKKNTISYFPVKVNKWMYLQQGYSLQIYVFKGGIRENRYSVLWLQYTLPWPSSKSKFKLKSDRVNLVAQASSIECLLNLTNVWAIQYKFRPETLTRLGNSNVLRLPVPCGNYAIFTVNIKTIRGDKNERAQLKPWSENIC